MKQNFLNIFIIWLLFNLAISSHFLKKSHKTDADSRVLSQTSAVVIGRFTGGQDYKIINRDKGKWLTISGNTYGTSSTASDSCWTVYSVDRDNNKFYMGDCDGDYYLDWTSSPSFTKSFSNYRTFVSSSSTYGSVCLKADSKGYYLRLDGSALKAQSDHCKSQEQWWFLRLVSEIPQETGLYAIEHQNTKQWLVKNGDNGIRMEASPNGESDYWWIDYWPSENKFSLKNLNEMKYLCYSGSWTWQSTLYTSCVFYLPDANYIVGLNSGYLGHDGNSFTYSTNAGSNSKWNFYKVNS